MKTKSLLLLIACGFAVAMQASAQNSTVQDSKGFIGINGGYSIPFGNITKTTYLDTKSGFAKAGPVFGVDGAYFFSPHIGIGAVVSEATYGVKNQSDLGAGYVEAFAVEEVTLTVGTYKVLNVMPALYYTLPFNKLHVDFRLMAGYTSMTTPKVQAQLEDNTATPLVQKASTGGGFGFGLGAGLRYAFTSHFGAALKMDFVDSKPNVKTITYENLNNPTEKLRVPTSYNESIPSLNATVGLFYQF